MIKEERITVSDIHRLVIKGQISSAHYLAARALLRDEHEWRNRARLSLLALGVGQVVAALIFFFAFNWAEFPDIGKFAVIELAIIILSGSAWFKGLDHPLSQALGISAFVALGVLLAVIGQVYQTGADLWTLFAVWAGLSLPVVFALRNAIAWLIWLTVSLIAATLYTEQVWVLSGRIASGMVPIILAVIITLAFTIREGLSKAYFREAGPSWIRYILLAAMLGFWTLMASVTMFQKDILALGEILSIFIPIAGFILVCSGVLKLTLFPAYDMLSVTMVFLAISIFLSFVAGRLLFVTLDEEFSSLFLIGIVTMTIFGGMAVILLRLSQARRE
ncbi:MAG: DUF2157 domain-containing protein [Alphaproteobacteria bacterium]